MLNNIKKISGTRFKKTNFKAFSFFLLFSLLIWMLVQFSKTYEKKILIPLKYVHVPKDKIVSDENKFLRIRVEENGFKLTWLSLFENDIQVDLSKLTPKNGQLVYDVQENSEEIRQKLGVLAGNMVFLDETIRIGYEQKAVKTVPVISKIELNFEPGYASNDSIRISPDSIKISGPKKRLDSIKSVKTLPLVLKKIDGPVSGKVSLDTTKQGKITFYNKKVNYALNVEKFTEGKLVVPFQVINAPDSLKITTFPKTLEVVFKVSLENFDKVSKSDFKIVGDYSKLEEGQSFFIPKITKRPEVITNLRLSINKIEFIIKK